MENKDIVKALEEKIDGIYTKIESERASKTDVAELNKSILNIKATLGAMGEDSERESAKFVKTQKQAHAHWSKAMKKQWAREMAISFDAENAWRKANDPAAFRKAFVEKASNVNEIDSTSGLGMLPTAVDSTIQKLIPLYGVARNNARVISGIHGSININRLNAYPTFARTITSSALRDDSTVTPNSPTYAYATLQPYQSSGIAKVTEKLIYDGVPGVLEDVAEDLAIQAGVAEDTELFLGDGTATYGNFTGLKTATIGYNSQTVGARTGSFGTSSGNFDPLLQCQQNVYPSIVRSGTCKYHMVPATFALLQTFKASTSGVYHFDLSTNEWKISGTPIEFNQVMDGPDVGQASFAIGKVPVIYGDLRRAVTMGIGRDYQLKTLVELYAATNEVGLRLTYEYAFAIILASAVTRVTVVS